MVIDRKLTEIAQCEDIGVRIMFFSSETRFPPLSSTLIDKAHLKSIKIYVLILDKLFIFVEIYIMVQQLGQHTCLVNIAFYALIVSISCKKS